MPAAEIWEGAIAVETSWNEKDLIKSIPGSRWHAEPKRWTVPLTWAACCQLRGIFKDNLIVGPTLSQWSWAEFNTRVKPSLHYRGLTDADIADELDERLYPFQRAGVIWQDYAESGLLGDDMGTGKTIQVLAALHRRGLNALPAIVICPNSVKTVWGDEAAKWFPEANPYVIIPGVQRKKVLEAAATDTNALVIVNYESVPRLSRLAGFGSIALKRCRKCDPKWGTPDLKATSCEVHERELNKIAFQTVVVDEAHRIKDPKAKQTRACWALGQGKSVERRWAATGTPVANDPSDLWSIMHFVDPAEYPTKSKFVDRYCLQSWNEWGGLDVVGVNPANRDEFFKILDPRFRRMPAALVLDQLPPLVRVTRTVEMTPQQRKAYKEVESRLITKLDDGTVLVAPNSLAAQIRLLQLSSSYCTVTIPAGEDPNDIVNWKVELREPSPKIDELIDIIAELGRRQFVVCAESRKLINLASARLTKIGVKHGLITGEVDTYDRKVALDALQSGDNQALLFTLKAGGTGLTMTAADTMIRLQRSWSMIDNSQGEKRVYRIGSERHSSVQIIDVITADTVEIVQLERLNDKLRRLEEINRDRATLTLAGRDTSELDRLETVISSSNLGTPTKMSEYDVTAMIQTNIFSKIITNDDRTDDDEW